MTKDVLLMLLGTWVALLPFLGFPSSWDRVLLLLSGVCIIALGIAVRRAGGRRRTTFHGGQQGSMPTDVNEGHDSSNR